MRSPDVHREFNASTARFPCAIFILALLLSGSESARAQAPGERRRNVAVSPGLRDSIIERTVRLVRENYADSVAAQKLASDMDARWRRGEYARIDSAAALTESLTTQMRRVHADGHLRLDYFVVARPMRASAGEPTPEDLELRRRESARRGYGIERIERLPGNVAVLTLRSFEPLVHAGASLSAAMALAASADGLIIDLRQNGGGYGDMVAELQRYFLPADAPMSERFDRPSGKTHVGRTSKTLPNHHFGQKPLYILTSKRTFSGAEAFAYSMQARSRGVVVGETSRGGANPVQVFQLSPRLCSA